MNLQNIPPLERKLIIWYHNGRYYTPEKLQYDAEALQAFQKVLSAGEINRELLKTIVKERLKRSMVLPVYTLSGEKYSVEELRRLIDLEEGIGKKLIDIEMKRVTNIMGLLR